ncbi:hypothetical protein HDZ31DRAFT_50680 [Schizophyllum fasciatum]
MSSAPRAPLREMPLDLFVAPQPRPIKTNIFGTGPASPHSRPNKRPHSPGEVGLYSPAKRRILEVEGIISPQKMKSPFSSAYRNPAADKFADALLGPGSPAKRLDFLSAPDEGGSLSSSCTGNATPKATPARLAPSPKLRLATDASHADDCEMTDYFSPPLHDVAPPTASSVNFHHVPRVPPPLMDATSLHYPGFQIHLDEFDVVYEPQADGAMSTPAPVQKADKENVPAPRRGKMKKSATDPIPELTALLFSPEGKKSVLDVPDRASSLPSMLISPARAKTAVREGSPTPRSTLRSSAPILVRDACSSPALNKEGRRERRRMLEDEVDAVEEDEDSDGVFL